MRAVGVCAHEMGAAVGQRRAGPGRTGRNPRRWARRGRRGRLNADRYGNGNAASRTQSPPARVDRVPEPPDQPPPDRRLGHAGDPLGQVPASDPPCRRMAARVEQRLERVGPLLAAEQVDVERHVVGRERRADLRRRDAAAVVQDEPATSERQRVRVAHFGERDPLLGEDQLQPGRRLPEQEGQGGQGCGEEPPMQTDLQEPWPTKESSSSSTPRAETASTPPPRA